MMPNSERKPEQFAYPYVNMNGDTRETLIEDRLATVNALCLAMERLSAQYPHGRNYQTAPPGAYLRARELHDARVATLRRIASEISVEALFIQGNF
jgi:hypothetical protein